ncbi:MAG: alpha/beta hydrolase [Candidatus Hodarchaeota archaeon]
MVSKQMKYVIKGLLYTRSISIKNRVKEHRTGLEKMSSGLELPEDVKSEYVDANGVQSALLIPPDIKNRRTILFLHGGAYIAGSIKTSQYHAEYISRASNAQVLIVDYRLAPEYQFPAALEDAINAYRWLIDVKGIPHDELIIVGVSAGGGLTIATLLKLRALGMDMPKAAVCISPWVDLTFTGETFRERAKMDPFLTPDELEFAANLYYGDADPRDPFISPIYADLQRLPPLFIQAGTAEILYDDAVHLAKNAEKAGVDVKLDIWEDMIHAFPVFVSVTPESEKAIERISKFIHEIFKNKAE